MPYINTAIPAERFPTHDEDLNQVYNGLDCCLTLEIWQALQGLLDERPFAKKTFWFRMEMLGPLNEMALRGMKVNQEKRDEAIKYLTETQERLEHILNKLAEAVWDQHLNPRSPKQLQAFFYQALNLKPVYKNFKGERKVSTERAALEKLADYYYAAPFVQLILAIRDTGKLCGVLRSGIDADGRMRTSYNAGGTDTGRLSSNKNVFGGGTNLQNITPKVRPVFESDIGWKLAVPDGEQAESRVVAGIMIRDFNDYRYHQACLSGDLHTTVAKMVWKNLSWTGDLKKDKEIAESPFYRQFSYRDMSKRGGHGTNYYGKPPHMAKQLKIDVSLMQDFYDNYMGSFGLDKWHKRVAQKLMTEMRIVTAMGMERHFFDRPDEDATLRKAIAYEPQSVVGQMTNTALLTLWREYRKVMVLLQIHDAVGFLYPDDPVLEPEILEAAKSYLAVPIQFGPETITIPWEMKVGWNWGNYNPKAPTENPDGLMKFRGKDERVRTPSRLDQFLSTLHITSAKP